jgi:hypothetical protein
MAYAGAGYFREYLALLALPPASIYRDHRYTG